MAFSDTECGGLLFYLHCDQGMAQNALLQLTENKPEQFVPIQNR